MKLERMKKMKTYQKMQADTVLEEKDIPKAVAKHLADFVERGLIQAVEGGYIKPSKPAWVEAAEAAVAPEEPQQPAAPAVTQFGLVLGNRAASIVQLCDALQNGTAGLTALGDIRGHAMMMLYDLNLLAPVEPEVAESD